MSSLVIYVHWVIFKSNKSCFIVFNLTEMHWIGGSRVDIVRPIRLLCCNSSGGCSKSGCCNIFCLHQDPCACSRVHFLSQHLLFHQRLPSSESCYILFPLSRKVTEAKEKKKKNWLSIPRNAGSPQFFFSSPVQIHLNHLWFKMCILVERNSGGWMGT